MHKQLPLKVLELSASVAVSAKPGMAVMNQVGYKRFSTDCFSTC
ncbi:hypothetical protein CZ787_04990 [Halomonas citrativorans]|uniref:Uncharacterized protein n=1 Tax=Halomonas citrativorans TaxID=2742612 RepID=A0A1R4HTZ6_9GAMM|nr:hypothetical protein CZ787_04990 [Halomonas citrativorans]